MDVLPRHKCRGLPALFDEQPALSEDALTVQTITADLQRAGVTSNIFRTVQRHGYLRDWDQERWLRAEQEMAQARLLWARQQSNTMDLISIGEVIEEVDDDESLHDG